MSYILVFYVNVGNIENHKIDDVINNAKARIKVPEDIAYKCGIVHQIFIPIRSGESRVEQIYFDK